MSEQLWAIAMSVGIGLLCLLVALWIARRSRKAARIKQRARETRMVRMEGVPYGKARTGVMQETMAMLYEAPPCKPFADRWHVGDHQPPATNHESPE